MNCWRCGAENVADAAVCRACGSELKAVEATVLPEGDGTGGIIPFKNPKALWAYYLGILSGLPIIGLPIGIAAFVLGIQGLKARRANPVIKGSIHAGIGVGCGCFFTIFWTVMIVGIIFAILSEQ